jgi:predicted AAA+ superfamily ATPase
VKRTTPSSRDIQADPTKVAKDFDFPFHKDEVFNRFVSKFLYSFKNIYSENINAKNLMFITGPTKSGKSWMLRYNLRKFQLST